MKRTFLLAAVILVIAVAFNFISQKVVSQNSTTGTITVCYSHSGCSLPTTNTKIELWLLDGTKVGDCTIDVNYGSPCCSITGDFQTGQYTVRWSQDGVNWCTYGPFNYKNGTNIELDVVCTCPQSGNSKHK